jgi:hypothetical protein
MAVLKPWKVIKDPSGDFKPGVTFGIEELVVTAKFHNWPEGIEFQNVRTQSIVIYRWGKLLSKKNRLTICQM